MQLETLVVTFQMDLYSSHDHQCLYFHGINHTVYIILQPVH